MTNIIVAFPKMEDAKGIKNLLVRSGYEVQAICTTGSMALHYADGLINGIIISAYKLPDLLYADIKHDMPQGFSLLLLASRNHIADCVDEEVVKLAMPFTVQDLVNTIAMMDQTAVRRRKKLHQQPVMRSEEEKKIILEAKRLLIERNNLSEEEAHRYIQKCSMDSATNMVETAQMVLSMLN